MATHEIPFSTLRTLPSLSTFTSNLLSKGYSVQFDYYKVQFKSSVNCLNIILMSKLKQKCFMEVTN